jgi:hypothetical protein
MRDVAGHMGDTVLADDRQWQWKVIPPGAVASAVHAARSCVTPSMASLALPVVGKVGRRRLTDGRPTAGRRGGGWSSHGIGVRRQGR